MRDAVGAIVGERRGGDHRHDGRVGLGAPRAVDGLTEPWAQVQAAAAAAAGEESLLKLELVLQTSGEGAPRDIRQKVGEGEVAILFEKQ